MSEDDLRERQELHANYREMSDTRGWHDYQQYLLGYVQRVTDNLIHNLKDPGDLREAQGQLKALSDLGSYGQRLERLAQREPELP
jgi:hypothetical protein